MIVIGLIALAIMVYLGFVFSKAREILMDKSELK